MQLFKTLEKSTINIPSTATITMKKVGRTAGYDGHALRAYSYWPDKMPDIDPTSVTSINSIKQRYEEERSKSKAPTFALT